METRKRRHIDVCLSEAVDYQTVTTGLERYRLPYNALTQTDLGSVDLTTDFLGTRLRAPVLIGAIPGGAELSGTITPTRAAAAQQLGVGMMLGSQRIMLDNDSASTSFSVRDVAPDVLLIGNIGLAQLDELMVPDLVKALDRVGANALAVHTNPLQEAMQHEGDTDFSGSISRLRDIAGSIGYPVMLKEVGHGIGAAAAAELGDCPIAAVDVAGAGGAAAPAELVDCPIAAVDVAGAGGTSWARVEQFVRYGEIRYPALAEWGIPTAEALLEVQHMRPDVSIVASGGIRTGMDAAKVLAMGADAVAVARPLLAPAIESPAAVVDWLQRFIDEMLVCLHGCGAANLKALRRRGVTKI